ARAVVRRNAQMADLRRELKGTEIESAIKGRALVAASNELRHAKLELTTERRWSQALNEVRKRFGQDEANIYRDGDKLLIQLKKVGFAPGSATVPENSRPLLTKVKGVIQELHAKDVLVEGHADATGTQQENKKVSAR